MTPKLAATRTSEVLRLERVKELLEEASELPEPEREAFVRSQSDDETSVRDEVLSLLALDSSNPAWAEGPLIGRYETLEPGTLIGQYRIEKILGSGGMGTVALATREGDFEKKVALKVAHHRLSSEWAQRFEAERQILAELEHPNIARILDGGTAEDGRPYFVMEWVDGEPITAYCQNHELSFEQRLRLIIDVCSALEVAHRNLVVHRDVKPSNILVTPKGTAKLLDFGIAKQLDREQGDFTQLAGGPMTLRYGSPEQIAGEAITTATDVHGVGLLLFELLTGHHPWSKVGQNDYQLAKAIHTEDAPAASSRASAKARQRRLQGDLDAIIGKALRKTPDERYGSIAQLAADLRHHLDGLPVLARDATWSYISRRFIARHRVAIGFSAAILLTVLASGVVTATLWLQAQSSKDDASQARLLAEEERTAKAAAYGLMTDVLKGAGPNAEGKSYTAMDLVQEAEETLDKEEPRVQAELLSTIAQVYRRWGELDRAKNVYLRIEDIVREELPNDRALLAKTVNNLAAFEFEIGHYEAAASGYREALAIKQQLSRQEKAQHDIGKTLKNLADALGKIGDSEGLEDLYLEALAWHEAAVPPNPYGVASSLRSLGVLYHELGRLEESEAAMTRALSLFREAESPSREASTLSGLGRLAHDRRSLDQAESFYRQALEMRLRIFDNGPHLHIVSSWLDMARLHVDRGDAEEARRRLDGSKAWLRAQPADRYPTQRIRQTSLEGRLLSLQGKNEQADFLIESACSMAREEEHLTVHGRRACDYFEARRRESFQKAEAL